MSNPKVTVIIPVWNGGAWLAACFDALAAQSFRDFAVIVVDNGSTDDSRALTERHAPQAALIAWERNRGFAAAVNAGIRASRTEYVALLNMDTAPRPDWLANLVRTMDASAPDVGGLASKMLSMADPAVIDDCGDTLSWQGAAAKRGHGRSATEFEKECEIFSPCAGAALYRKSFLDELGGFDERFFAYLEDVDLGLRGRLRGYRYRFAPSAEVWHQGHGSGLPQARYVRLITRNRIILLLKNLPACLLVRHAASLLYGQVYFFIAYRRPLAALAGYFSVLPVLPHIVRERRRIQQNLKLTPEQVEQLLAPTMDELPLRELVRRSASLGMRLLDGAFKRAHRIIPMSWTSFCWVVALLFLFRGLFFLSVYPPLEGFDEHQHIAYLVYLGQNGDVPKYGEAMIPKGLYPDLIRNPHSTYGWRQLHSIGAHRYEDYWGGSQGEPDYSVNVMISSAFHPPLYYRLMSPIFSALSDSCGFRGAVYGTRILSIAFAALSIFFFVLPLKSFFGAEHLSKLGALAVSLVPMYLVYSARVSPDGLALLIASLVFFLLARIDPYRNCDLFVRALLIGALLGAGTLVRASIIMWLPVALLFLLFLIIKHKKRWMGLLFAGLGILIAYAALTGRYFLHNMDVYGQPVPGQEGLRMAALGKGFPDLIHAVQVADIWDFVLLRMVKDNLWTSGWLFAGPHEAFVHVYWWCVLFCLLGFVPWVVRRRACQACVKLQSPQLVALCIFAFGSTLLGAYLHALSSRIAYGAVITPSYYIMPAFIPFLALTLKLGQQWPGPRTWMLCAGLLSAIFIVTEMHSLFFVGATQWAYTHAFGEMMRRLSDIHPFFPSPMWMPVLAVCMGVLLFLIIASIRISFKAAQFVEQDKKNI